MENTNNLDPLHTELTLEEQRPQFLKVLCILSFIACGLLILVYSIGCFALMMDEEMIASFWDQAVQSNPALENLDPVVFMHEVGMVSVYCLIANIFSLVGVIMMWKLEKIGFFIYALAELSTNFFNVDMQTGAEKSYAGTIFMVAIDLVFIVMYAMNLKYMNKKNGNSYVQGSGV